jgi:predicted dehydrogenase
LLAGKHVLSEKPVAENLQEAQETITWYRSEISGASWCVAENWRFLNSFQYACGEVKNLGRLLGFQVRSYMMVETDWNYFSESPGHITGDTSLLIISCKIRTGERTLLIKADFSWMEVCTLLLVYDNSLKQQVTV